MKKGDSVSMQPIVSSPGISNVPDVLPLSASNPAFRVYEDIEPPQEGPTSTSQLQRQNAVDMPAPQQPLHHPREQRKISTQSASSAPPVPTTRRPFDVITSRLRSLTDITEPPPIPSTRRPFRSLSEDSPVQVNTGPPVFGSGRDDPPALVPRVGRLSDGSLSENKSDFPSMIPIPGQEKALYSNITPISENNEDDTDADGYVKCVHSRDGPQTVVQV